MFYLMLVIIGIVLWIFGVYYDKTRDGTPFIVSGVTLSIIMGIIVIIMSICGVWEYPILIGKIEKINVQKHRIIDIKNSVYTYSASKEAILNGSIENIKQSTNLSDAIGELSKLEQEYNSDLMQDKLIMKAGGVYFWFTNSMYYSSEIESLQPSDLKEIIGNTK